MFRFVVRTCVLPFCLLFAAIGRGQTAPVANPPTDEFAAKQKELAGHNPAALSFTVRFANGKTTFQQGEIIPLELAFSSSKPGAFSIDSASYDRSGRLFIDTFVVDAKTGVTDPLMEYFRAQDFFMMGGLRGYPELTEKPYLITAELNEWRRFDQPGKYRVYVISGRPMKGKNFDWDGKFGVTSNLLEFEIVPATPRWAEQTLQAAVKVIDGSSDKEKRTDACRTLRFLNTEGAAREMIRRFGNADRDCSFDYQFGLLGSPLRSYIVKEMERELDAPTHPITSPYIYTLAFNAWLLTDPTPLPPYPDDEGAQASWRLLHDQRRDALQSFQDKYDARLAVAATHKGGPALAISLLSVFESTKEEAVSPDLLEKIATVFLDLPGERQANLLEYRWKGLASPMMLPVLRKVYEHPADTDQDNLRSLALRRLYELAPAEGRQLILNELALAQQRVDVEVLRLLPETELPVLEQSWAERLSRTDGLHHDRVVQAQLIDRYGTKAVLPKLRAAYSERIGHVDCGEQSAVLRYFLRTDEPFGVQMLNQTLDSRVGTGCYKFVLKDVATDPMPPAVEQVVLDHLNDPDLETAIGAVKLAGEKGSVAAEPKLWGRLEAFHEAQKEHNGPFEDQRKHITTISPESLEAALLEALAKSPAWLAEPDKLKRLQQLCLTPKGCDDVANWLSGFNSTIGSTEFPGRSRQFSIAQYDELNLDQLKTKLLQFPAGTTFQWPAAGDGRTRDESTYEEVRQFLSNHGMKLVE
jgi:hypothetical protein